MDIMAIHAAHFARNDRVRVREAELAALVLVALEARFGRFARIDDGAGFAGRGRMQAARTVADFAADIAHLGVGELEPRMGRAGEVAGFVGMTLDAFGAPDIRGAGDAFAGRDHDAVDVRAGDQEDGPQGTSTKEEVIK